MNRKQTLMFASLVSIFLVLAITIGLIIPIFSREKAGIEIDLSPESLSGAEGDDYSGNLILANREMVYSVEIKPENLSNLVSTLSRPSRYYEKIKSVVVSGDLQAVYTSRKWRSGGLVKTITSDSFGQEHNYLQTSDMVYSWKTGDISYNTLPKGDFSEDSLVRIPTYEALIDIDPSAIIDCGTDNTNGYDCIFALISYPETGYIEKYFVSIDYGLLVFSETRKNGTVVFTSETSQLSLDEFEESPFDLPNTSGG